MNANNIQTKPSVPVPKETCFDDTLKLLSEGYLYIPNRMKKYNTNIFQTRLIGKKVVCISGKEAAEIFYNQTYFTRKGVIPNRILETLFGKKGVQTLDGAAHMHRKNLFMSFMTEDQINRIVQIANNEWKYRSRQWEKRKQIVLFDEATKLFFEVACKWAGVPCDKSMISKRAKDMSDMIDAIGGIGPRQWKGRLARNCSEMWAHNLICEVRSGKSRFAKNTPLYEIAWYKDLNHQLLDAKTAAVELINVLRPITAVATYVTFGALALHDYPNYKAFLIENEDHYSLFAQEVRRFYPFAPFLGAKVRNTFTWKNHTFQKGDFVFLDLYGTNHEEAVWQDPMIFRPERFENRKKNQFDFIPQGGGDDRTGTRCPGEQITLELMRVSFLYLTRHIKFQVPLQDFSYPLNRIPTKPRSNFIMTEVQATRS